VAALQAHPGEDLMAVTTGGRMVRVKPDAVPQAGRIGAAEKSVAITGNERLATVTYVAERELPETPGQDEGVTPGEIAVVEEDGKRAVPSASAVETIEPSTVSEPKTSEDAEPSSNGAEESPGGPDEELDLFG
jgi:hypothetical protein